MRRWALRRLLLCSVAVLMSLTGPRSVAADALGQMCLDGIFPTRVCLADGVWEGPPFVAGGASRPRLELVRQLAASGDLDGDGRPEHGAVLVESAGGSGTRLYLAVLGERPGHLVTLATALIGDRVQLRSLALAGRQVRLEVVHHGPDDPRCCPTQKATRAWALRGGGLQEVASQAHGTIAVADLGRHPWRLSRLARADSVPAEPPVTLEFTGDQLSGFAGCNRFTASLREPSPRALLIGPIVSTKRACPTETMALEQRVLHALSALTDYGFAAGELYLSWRAGDASGTLFFRPDPRRD